MMGKIWTGRKGRVWYWLSDDVPYITSVCEITKLEFLHKPNTCEYCGHDILDGEQCPGCAARKSKLQKMAYGKASITIAGLMPMCMWLFQNPKKVEYHVLECGRTDIYANYDGRIVFSNLIVTDKSIVGLSVYDDEPMKVIVTFECDAIIEDNWNE